MNEVFITAIIITSTFFLFVNRKESFEEDLALLTNFKNFQINEEIKEKRETKNILEEEIQIITEEFLKYYNAKNSSDFFILEIIKQGVKSYYSPIPDKQYIIPLFLYDKTLNYMIRIRLSVSIRNGGNVYITNLEEFKEIVQPQKELEGYKGKEEWLYNRRNQSDYVLITKEDVNAEALRQETIKKIETEYTCLGVPGSNSIKTQDDCYLFGGVWDRPVKNSEECPFYKSNKNYVNVRGFSKNGYCEMPVGVKIKGYRNYSKKPEDFNPVCYNCKGNFKEGNCCSEQQNNKKDYPLLESPDYKFPGDSLDRPRD